MPQYYFMFGADKHQENCKSYISFYAMDGCKYGENISGSTSILFIKSLCAGELIIEANHAC